MSRFKSLMNQFKNSWAALTVACWSHNKPRWWWFINLNRKRNRCRLLRDLLTLLYENIPRRNFFSIIIISSLKAAFHHNLSWMMRLNILNHCWKTQCFVSSANRRVGGGKCVHKKTKKITRIPCQHQFGCRSGKERRTRSKEQRFYNFISIKVSSWDVYVAFAPVKREIRPNQRECIEKNLQFNSHAN